MKTLNVIAFLILSFTAFVRFGYAEVVVKDIAKEVVREVVKEEIKKAMPQLESPDISSWR
jgi:hypothetical protein